MDSVSQPTNKTYSSEVAQQILQRALARQSAGDFSYDQLQEMAAELSISPSLLQQAEQDWQTQQAQQNAIAAKQTKRRRWLKQQLITYAAVNTFLIGLNIIIEGTVTWAIYPLLGWGLSLLLSPYKSCQGTQQTGKSCIQSTKLTS
ncbi:2TM domain-containing protein [Romeria aff. gracilis LEGE 07310]|uniref:2TM domain-containing protein n=1 Tax=Vasconcelosia minhoensis LEGE 07310 TaxID=915328 RepID=A0A8J7DKF5_9CYAN|nr:2TM domain-containing protein [Romeria gracilis]MBE9076356.1 2TM domain-containing protein [Romeria aff. gracilis LEGE 07310]